MPTSRMLILGDRRSLADALVLAVAEIGGSATTALGQSDAELAGALGRPEWTAVVVVTHDDALALRLTLLATHLRPDLPLWVTLFDRTIVHRFSEILSSVHVVAAAELVAERLAQLCFEAVSPGDAGQWAGANTGLRSGVRVVDDALALMLIAGGGLVATLLVQILATVAALHDGLVDALYFSTRSIATVADVPNADHAPTWFKLLSTAATVAAVVLMAVFTAALVRRLSRVRLTTLFGARRPAARRHALLIGFGQIGFRLAQQLSARHIPVLVLERDVDAPCVRLARRAGIPVAIGRGDDRATLETLGVRRCAVLAAVTSDDLTNVAIGLAATDLRPDVPLVLRLGDGNVAAETESLLHLGRVCDAHELIARRITAEMVGSPPRG